LISIFSAPWGYFTRKGTTPDRAGGVDASLQDGDGIWFIQFHTDGRGLGAKDVQQDLDAAQQGIGTLHHEPVVVG
jgi:hypothetical protein